MALAHGIPWRRGSWSVLRQQRRGHCDTLMASDLYQEESSPAPMPSGAASDVPRPMRRSWQPDFGMLLGHQHMAPPTSKLFFKDLELGSGDESWWWPCRCSGSCCRTRLEACQILLGRLQSGSDGGVCGLGSGSDSSPCSSSEQLPRMTWWRHLLHNSEATANRRGQGLRMSGSAANALGRRASPRRLLSSATRRACMAGSEQHASFALAVCALIAKLISEPGCEHWST